MMQGTRDTGSWHFQKKVNGGQGLSGTSYSSSPDEELEKKIRIELCNETHVYSVLQSQLSKVCVYSFFEGISLHVDLLKSCWKN